MSTPKILKINPELFKFNNGKKSLKKKEKKTKPLEDKNITIKTNKLKKELLKRVKDYQKKKDNETHNEEKANTNNTNANNLFTNGDFDNCDFEREFNKSLTFLHELSKKKKDKRNKSIKAVPNIDVNIEIPKDSNIYKNNNNNNVKIPAYSCLKNGSKPTLRDLNKTQKNNNHSGGKKITINLNDNKFFDSQNSILDNETKEPQVQQPQVQQPQVQQPQVQQPQVQDLQVHDLQVHELQVHDPQIQETPPQPTQVKPIVYSYTHKANNISDINTNINGGTSSEAIISPIIEDNNNNNNNDLPIPKINRTTRTYKYTLGKNKGGKHVGLLLKNRDTQKRIKQEVSQLKQQPIQDIKNYLRTKNLIKLGSQAPNDVLRKLYEDSILAGEITNNNASNLVYNFVN